MDNGVLAPAVVELAPDRLSIQGTPEILMSASLFYFRIPRAYWRERMEQVKAFGYNSIDVYFPWNYHEMSEGQWDFSGERDVEAFLQTAAEVGIWVVARPGPYICSEWDGGALPAYLLAKPGLAIRSADPAYLGYVNLWFDRILPILRDYELGRKGTVIAVQLENELDFYACPDPKAYIAALRDMAKAHGLSVPLVACAGQGGLAEASGHVEGVTPTCNFYPNDADPEFDDKVSAYREALAGLGYPLLVTETNRSHYLLRRLLSGGAKLLGPYLQVSGTDFGFTTSTNNWGEPLAFLTTDYDFAGMISPEGHIREEAYEGRLLRRLIQSYGERLARASAGAATAWKASVAGVAVRTLSLPGGGELVFVTNLEEVEKSLVLEHDDGRRYPEGEVVSLAAGRSLALPVAVPMAPWGIEGALSSTAELYHASSGPEDLLLAFHLEGPGELKLHLSGTSLLASTGVRVEECQEGWRIELDDAEGGASLSFATAEGKRLILVVGTRRQALFAEKHLPTGEVQRIEPTFAPQAPIAWDADWRLAAAQPQEALPTVRGGGQQERAIPLEDAGIYRGYSWYESALSERQRIAEGLLLRGVSDVASVYAGESYLGTIVPGGGSRYLPLGEKGAGEKLTVRTEIWGHSNFDDARLPAIRIDSRKGLHGAAAVLAVRDLSSNWQMTPLAEEGVASVPFRPMVAFGGWLSPGHPSREVFRRSIPIRSDADSWTLEFRGLQGIARLTVNGQEAGIIHPFDPFVAITPYVVPGEAAAIQVVLERSLGQAGGSVHLYEALELTDWRIGGAEEPELLAHAASVQKEALAVRLPIELTPGEVAWLSGTVPASSSGAGYRVKVAGEHVKVTALFAGRAVGRLWLPGGNERPRMTGGSPDSFYLPGAWFHASSEQVVLLLEAVNPEAPARLERLELLPV
ncbi:beta-galactosidase [Gorillibacterium sp. CAU 1737]|uniref:beta-galactosidase n=1 Tax=Gorillibacterium sp. CAU 1737 TaxID=3140362 RepID=UPI00326084D5